MPVVEPSTRSALLQRLESQSVRTVAKTLGVSHGVVSRAARGEAINRRNENAIRSALALDALPAFVEVCQCPTCGNVHALADCNGKAGTLAIVGDGEEVKPKRTTARRTRPPAYRPMCSQQTKRTVGSLGMSVDDIVAAYAAYAAEKP